MTSHDLLIKSYNQNYLVTIAIGNKVYNDWKKFSFPLWKKYCQKNKIGLIVIKKDLIEKNNKYWKKATWQKMLIGDYIQSCKIKIKNLCYLDTDILINPNSPSIFKFHDEKKISLISESFNLPYNLNHARRRVSFLRNKYYSKNYPLDSSLFMSIKQKYLYHKLKPQKDYACAGVIVFNVFYFAKLMKSWFYKYNKKIKTLTGGGDEPIYNYEIFNSKKVKLLDYKFQALWFYEMAVNYPFLYLLKDKKNRVLKDCIEATLLNNYFLHFPGSWYEGQMWKIKDFLNNKSAIQSDKYFKYSLKKVYGKPIGRVLPLK